MEVEYDATVIDKNDTVLGTVDYIIRDSWTGDVKKFVIRRKAPDNDLFSDPEHVLETDKGTIKMSLPLEELEQL